MKRTNNMKTNTVRKYPSKESITTKNLEAPLRVKVSNGKLIIEVGINRLEGNDYHPYIPHLKIKDSQKWGEDVKRELEKEEENGQSPLGDLLDKAILDALEYGSDAIDLKNLKKQYNMREKQYGE
jgi:hypothetical protein